MKPSFSLRTLLAILRPLWLIAALACFGLGAALASFLGVDIDPERYALGQGITLALIIAIFPLLAYFDRAARPLFETAPPTADDVPRVALVVIASAALTAVTVFGVMLVAAHSLTPPTLILLAGMLFAALAYALPPLRLARAGYGELTLAVLFANLMPAFAYALLTGETHRLLLLLTLPITFLLIATQMALQLRTYLDDVRLERGTLMARLGWQRGMALHNGLIGGAYVLMAVAALVGVPWNLAYPTFLSLPLGIFWIVQMNAIANGGKLNRRLLSITAIATPMLSVYFLLLALWLG